MLRILIVWLPICWVLISFSVSSSLIHNCKFSPSGHQIKKRFLSLQVRSARKDSENYSSSRTDIGLQTFSSIPNSRFFSPIERVIITANGNLQRIMSAYLDAPVAVTVLVSQQHAHNPHIFDREIILTSRDPGDNNRMKILCYIKGEIVVFNQSILSEIVSGKIGVGQLFSKLHIQPQFTLRNAGKYQIDRNLDCDSVIQFQNIFSKVDFNQNSCPEKCKVGSDKTLLWRNYNLDSDQFSCQFVELFAPDFLGEFVKK